MNKLIKSFQKRLGNVGNPETACLRVLAAYGKKETAHHVSAVAEKAVDLARRFGADPPRCRLAAILHDVSTVIPNESRIEAAESFDLRLFPEERAFPMIIHQRLSASLAGLFFGVADPQVLSAISCHTTLKAEADNIDMVVFLADKISWDQAGEPPYLREVETGLVVSLERGAFAFVDYLIRNKASLKVVHPWLQEAHDWFTRKGF